jgi:hypothetical protein
MADGFAQVVERMAARSHASTLVLDSRPGWVGLTGINSLLVVVFAVQAVSVG